MEFFAGEFVTQIWETSEIKKKRWSYSIALARVLCPDSITLQFLIQKCVLNCALKLPNTKKWINTEYEMHSTKRSNLQSILGNNIVIKWTVMILHKFTSVF